ncbi:MAG: mechanosensitive ion channel family protein [Desulfatitalea sp.]|nr:mechanosensitive ion channel family protein [Desulfatitalea sp.]NNJ99689.1 mechanosensitive ion channel family protein [Desulfatitalea sp.]
MTLPPFVQSWLDSLKIGAASSAITTAAAAMAVLIVGIVAYYVARRMVRTLIAPLILRTGGIRDDILVNARLLDRMTLLVPALVVQFFIPAVLGGYPRIEAFTAKGIHLYFIVVSVMVLDALINALHGIYLTLKVSRDIPLTGLSQVFKIIIYCGGMIFIVSVIFNRAPVYLFSGLGAMTAVLMLIFKDPILGFVAGIQLISNRMLKQGDWIEMPKYGADGDVMDVSLTTVKVRNWDKTITTIPTYALISDSFKNWRGMQESGGRRIQRAMYIDMGSIRFCTPEMLERFVKIKYIADYLRNKHEDIARYNADLGIDGSEPINTRRLTNIGTFRAYVNTYLHHHPMINTDMTFLVRQLAPTEHGLPLEIYVFCKDKIWANYEAVQADIFDHLLAIVPEFDLRVFQYPTGNDFSRTLKQVISGQDSDAVKAKDA